MYVCMYARMYWLPRASVPGGCGETSASGGRARSGAGATSAKRAELRSAPRNFSSPHRACVVACSPAVFPRRPDGSGVRAALTNNKLEVRGVEGWGREGEGKQRRYLGFPLQRTLFLDRKIGQVRAEGSWGGVGGVVSRGGFICLLI